MMMMLISRLRMAAISIVHSVTVAAPLIIIIFVTILIFKLHRTAARPIIISSVSSVFVPSSVVHVDFVAAAYIRLKIQHLNEAKKKIDEQK